MGGIMSNRLRNIIVIVVIILILGIVYVIFLAKPSLQLKLQPSSAQIIIDQRIIQGNSTRLVVGEHSVRITAKDYIPYEKEINIKGFKKNLLAVDLRPMPTPQSIEGANQTNLSLDKDALLVLAADGLQINRINPQEIDPQKKKTALTPNNLPSIQKVIWQPKQELAIFKKDNHTWLYDFKRYDLLHQEIFAWQDNLGQVIWSPDSEKVIYYFADQASGEKSLIMAEKNNANQQRIVDLRPTETDDPYIDWSPDQKKVLVTAAKGPSKFGQVYELDLYSKDLKQITQSKNIHQAQYSPDGQYLLISYEPAESKGTINLGLLNPTSGEITNLKTEAQLENSVWVDTQTLLVGNKLGFWQIKFPALSAKQYFYLNPEGIMPESLVVLKDNAEMVYQVGKKRLLSLKLVSNDY
jgi:hypothetical protein